MTERPVESGSVAALIEQLGGLSSKLGLANDQSTRAEALRLSRKLTMNLERPEDVAAEFVFSVIQSTLVLLPNAVILMLIS